jgi:hypothetical protein
MFGLVTRRRLNTALDEIAQLRARVVATEARHDEVEDKRRRLARWLADATTANRRLHDRNLELGRRLSTMGESDPEYAARLEQRVARLRQVGARILAAYTAEKCRADRLASHLDSGDLKAIKEWEARVKKHDAWTPGDPEKRPVDGASGRPLHPAVELRRTQERCRQLQQLLDGRGKQVAS